MCRSWRQQEQFFAFQTRGINSIDHTSEMLCIGPQPRCQGVHELLAPLQVRRFKHHNERIKFVKNLYRFLQSAGYTERSETPGHSVRSEI